LSESGSGTPKPRGKPKNILGFKLITREATEVDGIAYVAIAPGTGVLDAELNKRALLRAVLVPVPVDALVSICPICDGTGCDCLPRPE
jgi:hypothetical protein